MDLKSKIILISGPTASGKSEFAVNLAKKINGEIINADSMQIYKEITILNTRPNKILTKKIKHHLYGFISVKKKFSVGKWLILTSKLIRQILKKKKVPIIVGGTGLYFKSLTDGLVTIPKIPQKIRNELLLHQKIIGQKKFYKELIKIDPISKLHIDPGDKQRSIRAYEVKKFSKLSLFDWIKKTNSKFKKDQFTKIYLDFPRDILLKRIEKRCSKIINSSSIKEVLNFEKLKVNRHISSNKIIGISDIRQFIAKKSTLANTKEKILIKTRQYAKRQITWSRGHMSDWTRISPTEIRNFLKKF